MNDTKIQSRFLLQVSAGDGPAEVRAFVARLAERLDARCRDAGLRVERVNVHGDARAPVSVELVIRGDAPAILTDDVGTHALVGRSSQRGRDARKRWFAGISLHAIEGESDTGTAPVIDPRDLVVTATRASGPGGQHVNKVATAVRVRHVPSGVEVKVADERSQGANVRRAIERIAARLAERARKNEQEARSTRREMHRNLVRGAPVRTYREGPRGALVPLGG